MNDFVLIFICNDFYKAKQLHHPLTKKVKQLTVFGFIT